MIDIPDAVYEVGERALKPYPIAEVDALDAASDVINPTAPLIVAAELRGLLREMEKMRLEMRAEDDWARRSSGLSEGILLIRNRIAELDPKGLTS
jgi:hypothetical protein